MARRKTNKSDAIREYLSAHPDAAIKDIIAGVAANGVKVSSALVANVRSRSAAKQSRPKAKRSMAAAHTPGSSATRPATNGLAGSLALGMAELIQARDFAEACGGTQKLREYLDIVDRLQTK